MVTFRSAAELAKFVAMKKGSGTHQTCFIIMSFSGNPIIESYYAGAVEPSVIACNLKPIRIDREHMVGQKITEVLFAAIRKADVIIADLTEDRENCYFEAGYAFALNKPIIFQKLCAPHYDLTIPFDLKDFQFISYGTIEDLRMQLTHRLDHVLGQ